MNHALSDLALRRNGVSLLPGTTFILDEAHMVESVASDHLGVGLSSVAVERLLSVSTTSEQIAVCLCTINIDLRPDVIQARRISEDFFLESFMLRIAVMGLGEFQTPILFPTRW